MNLPINYNTATIYQRKQARLEYIKLQNNICPFCKMPLNQLPSKDVLILSLDASLFPINFLKYPIHLHHDHNTGLTLGAIHAYCNGVLYQYYGQ